SSGSARAAWPRAGCGCSAGRWGSGTTRVRSWEWRAGRAARREGGARRRSLSGGRERPLSHVLRRPGPRPAALRDRPARPSVEGPPAPRAGPSTRGALMADRDLAGRRVLAIVTNYGVEQDELVVPLEHLREKGAAVDVAAASADDVQTLVDDKDPGRTVSPTLTHADADPAAYDLLLVPGGTINADTLRLQDDAVSLVRAFTAAGKPVAAICHGPWALIEAAAVE